MPSLNKVSGLFLLGQLLVFVACVPSASATDLSMTGPWSYQSSGAAVVLELDRIANHASGGNSGSLRLELWAFGSRYKGGSQPGYKLATYQMDRLDGGYSYLNISSGTIAMTRPAAGTWYMALLLTEWDGSKWILRYFLNSDSDQSLTCSTSSCATKVAGINDIVASISTNRSAFMAGSNDQMSFSYSIDAGSAAGVAADIYISVSLDLNKTLYMNSKKNWGKNRSPTRTNVVLEDLNIEDFYSISASILPKGSFQFSLLVTRKGTDPNNISNHLAYGATTVLFNKKTSSGTAVSFNPALVPRAIQGNFYSLDFYPYVTGGHPPYYFTLNTFGGFPPIGLVLAPNGVLSGIPANNKSSTFRVCAVDLDGNQSCKSITLGFTTPRKNEDVTGSGNTGTSSDEYYFANWTCGSSSACASIMGSSRGSTGLFCTLADCNSWGKVYIPGGYSCSMTATNNPPRQGTTANGSCARSGTDF